MGHRVLIVTIPPFEGGVPMMARILSHHLLTLGHQVTIAYYAPLSLEPELSAPSWKALFGAKPGIREGKVFGDVPCVSVGSWLPELEIPYYLPSKRWRDLFAAHDRHIAVGGNVLVSNPLLQEGTPHLTWAATPFLEDRCDRQARMPLIKRLVDRWIKVPALEYMERQILRAKTPFLCISSYTKNGFIKLGADDLRLDLQPVPTDTDKFVPPDTAPTPGIIGFAGRINDPRKNIPMLLDALVIARADADLHLRFTSEPDQSVRTLVAARGLEPYVTFLGELDREDLPAFYQGLDIFALPSHQEGQAIVGVEAMACGVPVVSTRCGGPEDFVEDGVNGYLVDHTAADMAARLVEIANDRDLRQRFSIEARRVAVERYGLKSFVEGLAGGWEKAWGDSP